MRWVRTLNSASTEGVRSRDVILIEEDFVLTWSESVGSVCTQILLQLVLMASSVAHGWLVYLLALPGHLGFVCPPWSLGQRGEEEKVLAEAARQDPLA